MSARQDDRRPGLGVGGSDIPRAIGASRVCLGELVARGVKRFAYEYYMGDSWEHRLHVEKLSHADPAASHPRLVDGAMQCPPEDIGGVPGFYQFLEVWPIPTIRTTTIDWTGTVACSTSQHSIEAA